MRLCPEIRASQMDQSLLPFLCPCISSSMFIAKSTDTVCAEAIWSMTFWISASGASPEVAALPSESAVDVPLGSDCGAQETASDRRKSAIVVRNVRTM